MANEDGTSQTDTSTKVEETPADKSTDQSTEQSTEQSTDKSTDQSTDKATDQSTDKAPAGDDWASLRTKYAKGDEKLEKRLARYSSAEAALDALVAAQNKIASGAVKSALPKDATPEQLAEWRAENGVPTKPEEYDLSLPDGRVIGEEDKALVDAFLKEAHTHNMSPEQVKATVGWYLAEQERQLEALQQQDLGVRASAEEALRQEWGSEYKLNVNLIGGMLDTAPEGVKDQLLGARLADGTPLGNDPHTLRWLANLARTVNPVATVVPGAGGNALNAIEDEISAIEKLMGDRKSEYWKGPKAEKTQARYRELIDVRSKVK